MLAPRRILIADDDLEVRRGVVDLLSSLGSEILQAESGLEALSLLRERAPIHLLLLDMHMPGCGGLEVIDRLRGRFELPFICYSGNATRELESQVRAAGAFAFLHKPVQPDRLRAEVVRALGRWDSANKPS
ncbi:MAG: response regulator [Planctomycetes bacterium]|nr:response regulator [Planctomycetota bacterium]